MEVIIKISILKLGIIFADQNNSVKFSDNYSNYQIH